MLRLATLGTSSITRQFIEATRLPEAGGGVEVMACASRDAARAASFAESVGVARGFSFDSLLSDPDVDAVYVASPNAAHYAQVESCLAAGKHVLCEKPLVPTYEEAVALFSRAESADVVLMEAMRLAYDPGMEVVRSLVETLGPVRRVSLRYHQRSARYDLVLAGEQVNIFDPSLAGGALLDLGVYCVHALLLLFGEPSSVVGASVPVASGADGAGVIVATYPGFVADLSYSKITSSPLPCTIEGELGTVTFDEVAAPRRVVVDYLDRRRVERVVEGVENNLAYEVARFAWLVGGGSSAAAETARSLAASRVMDAARGLAAW